MRNICKFIAILISSIISILLFWFVITPPESWVTILALTCIWIFASPFLIIVCGIMYSFNGPFTLREKRVFWAANPPSTIMIHVSTSFAWSYILFTNGHFATGFIYTLCIISLVILSSMYLNSKKPPPVNRMNMNDLHEYICDHSIDYWRN